MVISAPTGSGKTVLFELCILRLFSRFISEEGRFIHSKGTLKTIYIAPSKALVQEKVRGWNEKFVPLGINCLELTGDNDFYNIRNIQEADIILTTPEKFDAVTRYRIKDGGLSFFGDIALLLIDEVHLLNDPRGATLEAIVSRIKMLARNPELRSSSLAHVRFLAVSATIPNIEDLAEWLQVPAQGIKRFGEEMRPVKLTTKVFDILMHHSRGKSALVFCSTRKGAQEAAQRLSQTVMSFGHSNPFIKSKEQLERLREASLSCSDKQLQSYIIYGVGYHNGGLSLKDRNLIEGLFLKGDVQILCTTNTLAHGINLPAHTVVIKSTQHFNKEKGLYMEYDRSTVLQMCGRAGRPPFDDTGMAIIMTRRETVHLYENLLNGCEMVESQYVYPLNLISDFMPWDFVNFSEKLKVSNQNPDNYLLRKGTSSDHKERDMQEPGKLMTKYYLKFDTMKHIMETPVNCSLEDVLHIVCCAEEIAWIQLRRNEKKLLNDINTDKDGRLRFHILDDKGKRKKRIQTREEKIFVLANDCLTGDPSIHDLSLTQDVNSICSNGCRIAKCMREYFIYKKNYKGAMNSTGLAKSFHQKLWDDSPYLLKQLPGIGMVTAKALLAMGITSFNALAEGDPRRIEIVTGRKYPFGNNIKDSLLSLPPKVDMKVEEIECQRPGKSKLVVTLTRLSQSVQSTKRHYADMIIGSEEDNSILFHEKISRVDEFSSPYSATILLSKPHQGKLTIKADLLFEEYIGIDVRQKLILMEESNSSTNHQKRKKKPSSFPPPKQVCIIDDDDNETTSRAPVKVLNNSVMNPERENGSLPSFNLLDEELGEGEIDVEVKEDESKLITEQTVFDHIREKAKNFPVLPASSNSCSPSSEALILKRKRTLEKQFVLHGEVEVLEETGRYKIPRQCVVDSSSESREADHYGIGTNKCATPKHHVTSRSLGAMIEGILPPEPEESTFKTSTEESIFDLIRKKSKNFPVINKSKTIDSAPSLWTKERSSESRAGSGSAASILKEMNSGEVLRDTIIILDSEPTEGGKDARVSKESSKVKHDLFRGSSPCTYGLLNPPPRVSSMESDLSSMKMLSFDISILKNNEQLADPLSSMKSSMEQPCSSRESKSQQFSPSVPRGQCCSSETATENREADSFLGFKSVFSFL
ncbi:putative ATP-dependent DNA helicase HFM1 [Morella rubra]|uniref:DNA 3'-5' helicase n=1 Tax=Morella rubra TaxID=262757 RepID=A0A6A1V8G3_9ROSI|nr:putative ATP-dependent DNA helicase HFM1 [Morella rubra]